MSEAARAAAAIWSGLLATSAEEAASVVLGLAYAVLATRRSRWCWVTGGAASAILIHLSIEARLPMQAALQVYYVLISVYGWWHWTREEAARGAVLVGSLQARTHVLACAVILVASALTARWLSQSQAAWPFLDSLTTWGSLYATWLEARVKIENWLYWIVIDSVLSVLFGAQGLYFVALLSVVYLGVSAVGFVKWLKTARAPLAVS